MGFLKRPKIQTPPDPVAAVAALPPPSPAYTPTKADASILDAGNRASQGYTSMISTGSVSGLTRKANTRKSSLIGGA